jgi:uncharacterized BrkB/YihY/UPF0761 family membrane protein
MPDRLAPPEASASGPSLVDRLSLSNSIGRPKLDPPLPATASRRARIWRTTYRLIHGLYLHDSLEAASGMAFHFFLSLMPLLVVLGFLLGHMVKERGVDVLLDPLLEATPSMATQVVRHELERLAGQNGALAPLGMVGFVWLSSSGVHGLINAFERAARATKRPWWKKRLMSIAWSIATVATLCGLAAALVTVDRFIHRIAPEDAGQTAQTDGHATPASPAVPAPSTSPRATEKSVQHGSRALAHENDATRDHEADRDETHERIRGGTSAMIHRRVLAVGHAPWERYCAMLALLAVSVGGLAIFYRFGITHPKGVRRRSWAGAVVAVTLFLLVSWGFGMYVATLGQYALYYGGLAAVAVLLFWLYLTSLALLVGAELNAQLEGIRD